MTSRALHRDSKAQNRHGGEPGVAGTPSRGSVVPHPEETQRMGEEVEGVRHTNFRSRNESILMISRGENVVRHFAAVLCADRW